MLCVHLCSVTQSRPTLCNALGCSPPGASVHRILQARILEWVAIPMLELNLTEKDYAQIQCLKGNIKNKVT